MNTKQSKQLSANSRTLRGLARLTFVLLALVCRAGSSKAQDQTAQSQTDQAQTAQDQSRKTNITRGYKIIGGDIQVPESYSPEAVFEVNLWPNGVVFYEFDSNVTSANQTLMLAAMRVWTSVANISFRPGRGGLGFAQFYIHIQNSTGNNSAVGVKLGGQILNMSSWGNQITIVHELGHALGLEHEHSRPDRDNFVNIITANIQNGQADQLAILSPLSPVYGPYDFDSVMHYDRCAFSTACPVGATCNCTQSQETIQVKPQYSSKQSTIGNATALSYLDGVTMSFLYPRGDFRFVDADTGFKLPFFQTFPNGSFFNPYQRLLTGVSATPQGGTLWIQPGTYSDVGTFTKPMTLRAPLGGVTLRARTGVAGETLATVSAASYNGEQSVESIAAAFGENLSNGTASATALPLPTTLAGATVKVKDAQGTERDAPLFFASPGQINYLLPTGTASGVASITVLKGGAVVAAGTLPVTSVAPGLFSANSSGEGVAAAVALRVRANGAQVVEPLNRFDQQTGRFVSVPIDLGPEGEQVFLILFGTGFRARSALEAITATIGDEAAEVLFAGGLASFAGLDQANVRLPRSLAGKGEVSILFTVDNRSANAVTVNVR